MGTPTEKAWEVFRSVFVNGEDVVVEDSEGRFYYGKLAAHNLSITLTRAGARSVDLAWDDIEFMAHDGFPVSRLMRMSRTEADLRASETPNATIKSLFDHAPEPRFVCGGCPFVAGPMELTQVFNRGNTGPRYWYRDDGEVLEFRAADGAVMHSYDTDHLFLVT